MKNFGGDLPWSTKSSRYLLLVGLIDPLPPYYPQQNHHMQVQIKLASILQLYSAWLSLHNISRSGYVDRCIMNKELDVLHILSI
jgi:hypothetical protein